MLYVGFSRQDMTPNKSVPLAGYGNDEARLSERVLHEVTVTCIAFRDEDGTLALVFTQDLCLMSRAHSDILKTMLDFFNSYERRQEFAKPYEKFFSEIQVDLANNIKDSLDKIADDFNKERYIPAQTEAKKSQEEKDLIAAENNRIRTTEIEPLRKKIQEFEKRATAEL